MGLADYILSLFLIIISLAITDMAASLHRLLNDTDDIEWDGQFLLMLFCVVMAVFALIAQSWRNREFFTMLSYPVFITFILELVLVYLLTASSLPDRATGRFSLREFYLQKSRYIWSVFALLSLSILGHSAYGSWLVVGSLNGYWAGFLPISVPLIVTPLLALSPRKPRVHWPLLVILASWFAWTISGPLVLAGPPLAR